LQRNGRCKRDWHYGERMRCKNKLPNFAFWYIL
jgi:hypothetical protein